MRIIKRIKISDWRERGTRTSQSFPGIAVSSSGRIVVGWRDAPRKEAVSGQNVLLSTSDDGGATWSAPRRCFTAPEVDGRIGYFRSAQPSAAPDGRLLMHLCWVDGSRPGAPFFNEANSGLLDCRIFLSESRDDGESWSEPVRLDTAPFAAQPTPITGPVLVFPDGEIASQFELNKPYDSPEVWRHLPIFNFSRDGGKTFYRHTIPAADPATTSSTGISGRSSSPTDARSSTSSGLGITPPASTATFRAPFPPTAAQHGAAPPTPASPDSPDNRSNSPTVRC